MDIYLPPLHEEITDALPSSIGSSNDTSHGSGDGSTSASDVAATAAVPSAQQALPVVLFCHGGVWASGATWHYAPLATRLAQVGHSRAVV